jgi:hypothetical protein
MNTDLSITSAEEQAVLTESVRTAFSVVAPYPEPGRMLREVYPIARRIAGPRHSKVSRQCLTLFHHCLLITLQQR